MRKLAGFTAAATVAIAVALFFVPTSVTRGIHAADCSAPILRVTVRQVSRDEVSADLVSACEEASWVRVGAGIGIGVVGLAAAAVLAIKGRPKKPVWDQENYRWADPV